MAARKKKARRKAAQKKDTRRKAASKKATRKTSGRRKAARKKSSRKKAAPRKGGRKKAGQRQTRSRAADPCRHTVSSIEGELWDAFEQGARGKRPNQEAKRVGRERYIRRVREIVAACSWDEWRAETLACAQNAGGFAMQRSGNHPTIRDTDFEYGAGRVERLVARLYPRLRRQASGTGILVNKGGIC